MYLDIFPFPLYVSTHSLTHLYLCNTYFNPVEWPLASVWYQPLLYLKLGMMITQAHITLGGLDTSKNHPRENTDDLEEPCSRNIKKEECLSVGDSVWSIPSRRSGERWVSQSSSTNAHLPICQDKACFFSTSERKGLCMSLCVCVHGSTCMYICAHVCMWE